MEMHPIPSLAHQPPSFAESQFEVILRRQRKRPSAGGGIKHTNSPTRFLNLSSDWEFAGWGTTSFIEVEADESGAHPREEAQLGQFVASAVAGNAVLGSVFYAIPPVVTIAGMYAPITLFISSLLLYFWRPIMATLAAALPLGGANYVYMLNGSTKSFALLAAAITLLDDSVTAVTSAATAASYIAGEISVPFPAFVVTICILAIFATISLSGIRESARIAFGIMLFHTVIMVLLMTFATVKWAKIGNSVLRTNWETVASISAVESWRRIFKGTCLSFLGLTGYDCSPANITSIKKGCFPLVLRNIHVAVIALNGPLMLLVLAVLPLEDVLGRANVLSTLASSAAGRWLRILVVVDAMLVLSAGILTGTLSSCALILKLAGDRVLPAVVSRRLPITMAPHIAILAFTAFSGLIYASCAANLEVVSRLYSIAFLANMLLFPLSALLLKFSRGRLVQKTELRLSLVCFTLVLAIVLLAGNVVIDPITLGLFALYLGVIYALFLAWHKKTRILRWLFWAYDQSPVLHRWSVSKVWSERLVRTIRRLKRNPIAVMVKTDEINHLFKMIYYVRTNEETSCVKLLHFYNNVLSIPSELEANAKILDEMFPDLTIDLVFVQASFTPDVIQVVSRRLNIIPTLMFISCPGPDFPGSIADLGGMRIIAL